MNYWIIKFKIKTKRTIVFQSATLRNKLCCSFLLTVLLFSYITTTMATPTVEDCKEITKSKAQCKCSVENSLHLFIQCPANVAVPQIELKIKNVPNSVSVKIRYNDIDSNTYKLLPTMNIGVINSLSLSRYPLSSGPISHLLHHLNITQMNSSFIELSDDLNVNITQEHLSGLTDLKQLVLLNIDLPHVSKDIFLNLPNLTMLRLSSSKIRFEEDFFADVPSVHFPNMNSKNLKQLPEGIFRNQSKLQELIILFSQLKEINRDLFRGATSIKKLILRNNAIESVHSEAFSLLQDLDEIDLSDNEIQVLPSELFSHNTKLKKMLIRDNRVPLKSLPSALFHLTNLVLVDITCGTVFDNMSAREWSMRINCGLNDIPANLVPLSMQYLDLSHNNLQSLPDDVFIANGHLIELYLSHNYLTEISSQIFYYLHRLQVLYMDNNRLKTISPRAFVHTESLTFINMENNLLNLVDPLSSQKENNLSSPFRDLANLHTLNLRNNTLCDIFIDWYKMKELKDLNLSYNNITSMNASDLLFHSNSELSINLNYNQIRKINFTNIMTLADSFKKTISLQLNNNPFDCDCNIFPFVQYVKIPHNKLSLTIDKLVCDKPENMKEWYVRNVDPKTLLCPFDFHNFKPPHCPNDCSCWVRSYDSVLIVNCSSKHLKDVPILPRVQPLGLKSIVLHIENNELCKLPTASTTGYADVTEIYAARNNLSQIEVNNLPQNLIYLDLSHNEFEVLNNEMLNFFNQSISPREVALSGNPWKCECESKSLLMFVANSNKSNTTISDIQNVNCASPTISKMTDYVINFEICRQDDQSVLNSTFGSFLFLCFLIALTVAFYYKYQTEIKVWMYKYGICSCFVNEEELDKDKIYDAFISYSHKDEHFIAEHLVPELEEGPIRFKLCVHVRDFVVGECIPDQIVRAIDHSRRTIIVLSENFINSVWAQMEFRLAHQAGLNEGRSRLIVILYGKIKDIDSLDRDLKAYITTTTYLEWNNPWFWDKMRYVMPHPSRKRNNLVQRPLKRNEDDTLKLNEIPIA